MKTLINKKQRGFSLVELMVVVAIMGTLAAIAIPAYNEYRKSAKKAAYRSDLQALHKGWLAFGVELDSFCERETSPEAATIASVGMESLLNSNLYGVRVASSSCSDGSISSEANCTGAWDHDGDDGNPMPTSHVARVWTSARPGPGKNNFLGFGAIACGTLATPVANDHFINQSSTDANCDLGITEYNMGVFGHVGGINYYRAEINNSGVVEDGDAHRTRTMNPLLVATDDNETC